MEERVVGEVKRVMSSGYLFAEVEGEEEDIFVHCKSFKFVVDFNEILVGNKIEMTISETDKGRQGIEVVMAGGQE